MSRAPPCVFEREQGKCGNSAQARADQRRSRGQRIRDLRPANSATPATEYQLGDAFVSETGNVSGVKPGADGEVPGEAEHKKGLNALDFIRDVNIVAIPGIESLDVVAAGANYCGLRGDCFFIGDTKSTDVTVEDAQTFMNGLTVKNSYAALYYPWLRAADPTGLSLLPILVPPSGFVAGLYARIDATRGIWRPPPEPKLTSAALWDSLPTPPTSNRTFSIQSA